MATLFTDLLARLGPTGLASRLNITQRTARQLRFAPLSRFPRVTARARVLTGEVKTNILTRAGASQTEAARHVRKGFKSVEGIRDRLAAVVDTITANRLEFKAARSGFSTEDYISAFPDEFGDIQSSVREGLRRADKRLGDIEQDSV